MTNKLRKKNITRTKLKQKKLTKLKHCRNVMSNVLKITF